MTIEEYVHVNNLKPGDAIVMKKKWFPVVDHYVLYCGFDGEQHRWIANYINGVSFLPQWRLEIFLERLSAEAIERFPGTESERIQAMERANRMAGSDDYNWIANNCEHFKNYIHKGEFRSQQVITIANTAMFMGLALTTYSIATGGKKLAIFGALLATSGAIVRGLERKSRGLSLR